MLLVVPEEGDEETEDGHGELGEGEGLERGDDALQRGLVAPNCTGSNIWGTAGKQFATRIPTN